MSLHLPVLEDNDGPVSLNYVVTLSGIFFLPQGTECYENILRSFVREGSTLVLSDWYFWCPGGNLVLWAVFGVQRYFFPCTPPLSSFMGRPSVSSSSPCVQESLYYTGFHRSFCRKVQARSFIIARAKVPLLPSPPL